MGIKFDLDKVTENLKNTGKTLQKAGEQMGSGIQQFGSQAVENIQTAGKEIQKGYINLQRKKTQPVTIADLQNPQFFYPSIIHVVDRDSRENTPLFKDAIGWKDANNGREVLHLFTRYVNLIKRDIGPSVQPDALYYSDVYNPGKYYNVSQYFQYLKNGQFGELEYIAGSLGAKKYLIRIEESSNKGNIFSGKGQLKVPFGKSVNIDASQEMNFKEASQSTLEVRGIQRGIGTASRPMNLIWFKDDPSVNALIDLRCSGRLLSLKERRLEIAYKTATCMNVDTALKMDAIAHGLNLRLGVNCSQRVKEESQWKLIYHLEF